MHGVKKPILDKKVNCIVIYKKEKQKAIQTPKNKEIVKL